MNSHEPLPDDLAAMQSLSRAVATGAQRAPRTVFAGPSYYAGYDSLEGLELRLYPGSADDTRTVTVTTPDGRSADFTVVRSAGRATVTSTDAAEWAVRVVGADGTGVDGGSAAETTTGHAEIAL